jgi:GAF domain-containing protein
MPAEPGAIPPFPLSGLIDYLANYTYTDPGFVSPQGGEFVCLLIVFGLCVPLIVRDRRGQRVWGKLAMYMDKRIAA